MKVRKLMRRQPQFPNRGNVKAGVTVVEFALIAPIVFALFFGAIEFSRVNMLRHSIETAAYDGCRAAIIPGATAQDAIDRANEILNAASATNATVTVTPSTITSSTTNVTVTVELPLNDNTWVTPDFFFNRSLTTAINMNREYTDEFSTP